MSRSAPVRTKKTVLFCCNKYTKKLVSHPTPESLMDEYCSTITAENREEAWLWINGDGEKEKMSKAKALAYLHEFGLWGFYYLESREIHIFYNPDLVQPFEVLQLLGHELTHAHLEEFPMPEDATEEELDLWEEDFCDQVGEMASIAYCIWEQLNDDVA